MMAPTRSSKTFTIIHGFGEGPLLSRGFRSSMEHAGFQYVQVGTNKRMLVFTERFGMAARLPAHTSCFNSFMDVFIDMSSCAQLINDCMKKLPADERTVDVKDRKWF